jgi:hypothetical protein
VGPALMPSFEMGARLVSESTNCLDLSTVSAYYWDVKNASALRRFEDTLGGKSSLRRNLLAVTNIFATFARIG